jgi:leucyl aminopeptidase
VLEGIALASYEFQKYKSKPTNQSIDIWVKGFKNEITELNHLTKAVCQARDWVNEPVIELTALKYGEEIITFFQETEVKVDVLTIEELKKHEMGGLLAINKGAPNEPLFIICEYKPYGVTEAPIVLVGKGVMFDTGGISLKETPNSMDIMKCDMGGSAAVLATLYAVAQNKLPIHVIVLVPATENRPDGNAIVPSDIITMYGGKKVEVLNTDAEGRVILGDALEWAKQYSPKLVIDLATLTGSAMGTLGYQGAIMMGTADESTKKQLIESSFLVYERLVELPIWEEYEKEIESDIADIKNLGSGYAGAITAGAFLKAFTDYPWIHVDIAGPAFLKQQDAYRTKGGTGMGVRLLYDFLKKTSK